MSSAICTTYIHVYRSHSKNALQNTWKSNVLCKMLNTWKTRVRMCSSDKAWLAGVKHWWTFLKVTYIYFWNLRYTITDYKWLRMSTENVNWHLRRWSTLPGKDWFRISESLGRNNLLTLHSTYPSTCTLGTFCSHHTAKTVPWECSELI